MSSIKVFVCFADSQKKVITAVVHEKKNRDAHSPRIFAEMLFTFFLTESQDQQQLTIQKKIAGMVFYVISAFSSVSVQNVTIFLSLKIQ